MSNLSFAQSYILASKVRNKLTQQASNPKSSLVNLVTQANMLDNLMDHISIETEKRLSQQKSISIPTPSNVSFTSTSSNFTPSCSPVHGANITEYEVSSDSSDDDSYTDESDDDSELDSDSDYYYSSDDEEEIIDVHKSSYKHLPLLKLSKIIEEDEEEEPQQQSQSVEQPIHQVHFDIPELSALTESDSDTESDIESDDEYIFDSTNDSSSTSSSITSSNSSTNNVNVKLVDDYYYNNRLNHSSNNQSHHHHHRSNAIYSMDYVF